MANVLRSQQGCWSCRLRRKKCDEGRPNCTICSNLSITCHGYGPKPGWMDGGVAEKTIADEFKRTVKITSRRRTTAVGAMTAPRRPELESGTGSTTPSLSDSQKHFAHNADGCPDTSLSASSSSISLGQASSVLKVTGSAPVESAQHSMDSSVVSTEQAIEKTASTGLDVRARSDFILNLITDVA